MRELQEQVAAAVAAGDDTFVEICAKVRMSGHRGAVERALQILRAAGRVEYDKSARKWHLKRGEGIQDE